LVKTSLKKEMALKNAKNKSKVREESNFFLDSDVIIYANCFDFDGDNILLHALVSKEHQLAGFHRSEEAFGGRENADKIAFVVIDWREEKSSFGEIGEGQLVGFTFVPPFRHFGSPISSSPVLKFIVFSKVLIGEFREKGDRDVTRVDDILEEVWP